MLHTDWSKIIIIPERRVVETVRIPKEFKMPQITKITCFMVHLYWSESESDFAWKTLFILQQFVCEAILCLFCLHVLKKGLNRFHIVLF